MSDLTLQYPAKIAAEAPAYSPAWKNLPPTVGRTHAMLRHVPLEIRQYVFERDGYGCHYCGSQHNLSLDHIIPYSQGGSHEAENLLTACRECNVRRGVRPYGKFRGSVRYCVWPRIQNASQAYAQGRARINEITMDELRAAVAKINLPGRPE